MICCVIVANNRPDYLAHTLASVREHHPTVEPVIVNDTFHNGMAFNVQKAWNVALNTDCDHVLHLEDDMVILRPLPLAAAVRTLDHEPGLAQITFKREPWWGREVELGDQLAAICELSEYVKETPEFTIHDYIFSLNPCVIPRRVIELGWPSGPLGVGNETGMTDQLKRDGYRFAMWDHKGDPPYARHIGAQRGPEWKL